MPARSSEPVARGTLLQTALNPDDGRPIKCHVIKVIRVRVFRDNKYSAKFAAPDREIRCSRS